MKSNIICGVIYRQHNSTESFQTYFDETLNKLSNSKDFLLSLQSYSFIPTIDKPTRVNSNSATLIDNIFVNQIGREITSCNIVSDITQGEIIHFCGIFKKKLNGT